jgi:hypothetical protein
MKFGVREICDVVFKANQDIKIGKSEFKKGQPVLFIDTAKTSTIEGAATTVYATGGRGNSRLIAWEGERTLTFTVEDALLSPIGFSVLSGAGLFDLKGQTAMVHKNKIFNTDASGITDSIKKFCKNAPVFMYLLDNNGNFVKLLKDVLITQVHEDAYTLNCGAENAYKQVFVDYYEERKENVVELQIDAENFAGYYYVEGTTYFRRESDGKDLRAEIIFPRVKIQSNFVFNMASSGDPSTFTFTMDAFPAYTMFEKTKKVLCAMQIIDENIAEKKNIPVTVWGDSSGEDIQTEESKGNDSIMITQELKIGDSIVNSYLDFEKELEVSSPQLFSIRIFNEDGQEAEVILHAYGLGGSSDITGVEISDYMIVPEWSGENFIKENSNGYFTFVIGAKFNYIGTDENIGLRSPYYITEESILTDIESPSNLRINKIIL